MARPLNKRYMGTVGADNIKVTFKSEGTEYTGYIVRQRSTRKFKVSDGTVTAICKLVNKDAGALSDGDMIINVKKDDGTWVQATKLFNRVAIIEGNAKVKWVFDDSNTDGAVEMPNASSITIVTQPASVTVDLLESETDTAVFAVVASAPAGISMSYQWQKQTGGAGAWSNVGGATSDTYTTGALTLAASGDKYRVVITATGAENTPLTSAAATLTVVDYIVIDTQPDNVTVDLQESLTGTAEFSVAATIPSGLSATYQWQKQTGGAGAWANVVGATSDAYTTDALTLANSGDKYRVVITAEGADNSPLTSDAVTLTVVDSIVIDTQPSNATVDLSDSETDTATFTVVATIPTGLTATYQWQKQESGAGAWSNVVDATADSYTTGVLSVAADDTDKYRVVITAAGAENSPLTSDEVTLTVQE